MGDETVGRILEKYGVKYTRLLGVEKGYRNESHPLVTADGQQLNLIVYKNEPGMLARIRRANRVADSVAAAGFPARRTHDRRILRLRAGQTTKYAALYKYLPGHTIPWEVYTMAHLKCLGKAMGDMHALLCAVPPHGLPAVTDEYTVLAGRMRRYFADAGVRQALRAKLDLMLGVNIFDDIDRLLQHCCGLPGQQALHMDFVRGNILFAKNETAAPYISGVLDFEKTALGHPLLDIARTYAFLLVDCKHKTPDKVRKYFLHSGYNKYSHSPFKFTLQAARLLERLTDLFLLYDFYKFLRHNPYEYLGQNEHYQRTRHLLLKRTNILQLPDKV